MLYHYVNKEMYKQNNHERTACGRDMWEVGISCDIKDVNCKECLKKLSYDKKISTEEYKLKEVIIDLENYLKKLKKYTEELEEVFNLKI